MQRLSETPHTDAHDRLIAIYGAVVAAGERGDWDEVRDLHEAFMVAFAAHLRHEEQIEYPDYERASLANAADAEVLRMQHARLRQLAGRLSVELREGRATLDDLVDFQFAWALHDQREDCSFHRWLQQRPSQRPAPFVEGAFVRA